MAEVRVHEEGDPIKNWIAAISKTAGPPHKTTKLLEALLDAAFMETQAATHVITESLKASGKVSSDFDGDKWEGVISYGGPLWRVPTPGPPNDPVDYAVYEMARGGTHDFFAPLIAFDGRFEEAIMTHFQA